MAFAVESERHAGGKGNWESSRLMLKLKEWHC
jgi:hypothetical protein